MSSSEPTVFDEEEAQKLLEELHWTKLDDGKFSNAPADLQLALSKQSTILNVEIIDLLLQWEVKSVSDESTVIDKGTHDVAKVLNSLSGIDNSLEIVEEWLEEQMDRLSSIQDELSQIESDSSALETNWANLCKMKRILSHVIDNITLTIEEEEIISRADRLVEFILRSDLSSVSEMSSSLVSSLEKLKNAANFTFQIPLDNLDTVDFLHEVTNEGGNEDDCEGGNKNENKEKFQTLTRIQSMLAVTQQRQKLTMLSESFCQSMCSVCSSIFSVLLRHKSLNNPSMPNSIIMQPLDPRKLVVEGLLQASSIVLRRDDAFGLNTDDSYSNSRLKSYEMSKLNSVLQAQRAYLEALMEFLPILEFVLEMSSDHQRAVIRAAYVRATQEILYKQLFKNMFRDLASASVPTKRLVSASFESAEKAHLSSVTPLGPAVRLHMSQDHLYLTPWAVLEVSLLLALPVIRRELDFFQLLFNEDPHDVIYSKEEAVVVAAGAPVGTSIDTVLGTSSNRSCAEALFSAFSKGLSTLLDSARSTDGIESIAQLTILQRFCINNEINISIDLINEKSKRLEDSRKRLTKVNSESGDVNDAAADGSKGSTLGEPVEDSESSVEHEAVVEGKEKESIGTAKAPKYFISLILKIRDKLASKIGAFVQCQIAWLKQQKGDPKRPGVMLPFIKFPSFLDSLQELFGGHHSQVRNAQY